MRVAIITNVLPNYRQAFYERLVQHFGARLTIYCQSKMAGINIKTSHHQFSNNVRLIRHIGLPHERLVWQFLPFRELLNRYDCYFFYGNPRVVSTVVVATMLRMMGRKVVIWGQYHAAGASPILERVRLTWWRFFTHVFVYTDREAQVLRLRGGFDHHVLIGMNNGLDQNAVDGAASRWTDERLSAWRHENGLDGRVILLSCGRLDTSKKFDLMIEALSRIVDRCPQLVWCVVGDGEERTRLEQMARHAHIERRIRWLGAVHDENALAPLFLSATLLVHPGAIGLTLLHAYGYGVPVVTHKNDKKHGPEIAALVKDNESLRFLEDEAKDLAAKVIAAVESPDLLRRISDEARLVARRKYNTDVMYDRFCQMVAAVQSPSNDDR